MFILKGVFVSTTVVVICTDNLGIRIVLTLKLIDNFIKAVHMGIFGNFMQDRCDHYRC